jgi:Pycsar effector protein
MTTIEPANHLDHMLRQTRMHHVQLSAMADVKANIMLTLAALVTTFSIGYLNDPLLRWPVVVLILFCLATIFFAAYAVMPKLDFDFLPKAKEQNCNILFFGNFMNLEYEEFSKIIKEVMQSPERAYEAQIREIYELGVYLGYQKYRYVRLAYLAFISGLLSSGVTFLLVEVFQFWG